MFGIERNTEGVSRTVYLIGPVAIKFATMRYGWRFFLRGLLANLNERDTWIWSGTKGWDEFGVPRRRLAPVHWCSRTGLVLAMARADRTLSEAEFRRVPDVMRRVADLKADNVGVFGSNWLVIDYGEGWGPVEAEHERRGSVGLAPGADSGHNRPLVKGGR